jgi:N-acetylglucosamine malate deacetylase 2
MGSLTTEKLLKAFATGATLWPDAAAYSLAGSDAWTAQEQPRLKVLLVVAHPDDESECAAAIYRITHELGGIVDQVIVTDGQSGSEYSGPGATYYHGGSDVDRVNGKRLARIRRNEAARAGRILRIRRQYFFGQKDAGFTFDPHDGVRAWDVTTVRGELQRLIERENYDLVLTLLPTDDTHGHHKTVAALVLDAAAEVPRDSHPAVLGVQAINPEPEDPPIFSGLEGFPATRPLTREPAWIVNRKTPLPSHIALDYSIFVNWVIAEHKSQGLFQMEFGRKSHECFWLFEISAQSEGARERWRKFVALLDSSETAAQNALFLSGLDLPFSKVVPHERTIAE